MNITTEEPKGLLNLGGGAQNHFQKIVSLNMPQRRLEIFLRKNTCLLIQCK